MSEEGEDKDGTSVASAAGDWKIVGASVRGTSHVSTAAPCQDASYAVVVETSVGHVLVVACADGAGSAERSRDGARFACSALTGEVSDTLTGVELADVRREHVETWYLHVHAALDGFARELGTTVRELACTLLLAIVGPSHAVFAQIGDGAIITDGGEAGGYGPVFWPQSGEYANSTYFATDQEALRHLQVATVTRRLSDIALLTDGLQSLALQFATRTAHVPFFEPMFTQLRSREESDLEALQSALAAWLDSRAVNERTDDDKTLVLATRGSDDVPTVRPTA